MNDRRRFAWLAGAVLLVLVFGDRMNAVRAATGEAVTQPACVHDLMMPTPLPPPPPFPQMRQPISQPSPLSYANLLPAPLSRQFGIGVANTAGMAIELHPQKAHLSLADSNGRAIGSAGRFRFDPCIPLPLSSGRSLYPAFPDYWIGFHFNPSGLPAGLYRITASLDAGFATTQHGTTISIDPRYGSQQIAVYVSPRPDRLPSLVPGQQFVALTPPMTSLEAETFSEGNGTPVEPSRVEGRILTLQQLDATRMQFRAEGRDEPLYLPRAVDATSIYGLYPLVVDDTVRRLRAKYAGRRVWGYGGLDVLGGGWGGATLDGLPIDTICRAYGYGTTLNPGWPMMRGGVGLDSDIVTLDPLVIRFRTREALAARTVPAGATAYWVLSDAWDFERSYSLVSMTQAHPDWSAATRDEIQKSEVKLGMTKDMIAWMFGYPSAYGTVSEMMKLDTWDYDMRAPANYSVHFRNGVVVKYDPPRNNP